ncbi:eukaryotic translation initiation factor 3 subunit 6 [Mrakia frigida]|uniref:eukaryotic translation initiation factor 3 subunit 6 n=1 Tax=Mrakia frigida TaxID=29902 RepID=UPI003FCBF3F6
MADQIYDDYEVETLPDLYRPEGQESFTDFPGAPADLENESAAAAAALQQQIAAQQAFSQIPEDVLKFLVKFHQAVKDNDIPAMTAAYERGWNTLTQAHYSQSEWPSDDLIAPLVNNDPIFLALYRELYFRHVYARLRPNIDDRFHSYEASCELFNFLLNSDGPVSLELPAQWLWDVLDEFIYQFQSFGQWRGDTKGKSEEELGLLSEGSQVWSCYSVLNVLYSLIQKSKINEQLIAERDGASPEEIAEIAGEYGSKPLYRNLGYFSIICLLRVHVLLGDYTLALQVMDNIALTRKAEFTKVTACHVAVYYYVGFSQMALGRYPDASNTFVSILRYFNRMQQFHTRSYQYGQVSKMCDRMYALLAICTTLSPGPVDEGSGIMPLVREQLGDKLTEMSRGAEGLPIFSDLYLSSCPKFISANPPPYEDANAYEAYIADPPIDPPQRHLALFLEDVKAQLAVPSTRSLLKLYTSIDAAKLGTFLDIEEEEVLQQMMVLKQNSRTFKWSEGGLLEGTRTVTNNLDFFIDNGLIQVAETTESRRFATHFIRKAEAAQRVLESIRNSPLPALKTAAPAVAPTTATPSAPSQQQRSTPSSGGGKPRKGAWGSGGAGGTRVIV